MESKNIIIILLIVVVILAAAMAVMILSPFDVKADSKITIASNKTLYEGDNLTVKLTDLNKTPIKKEFINVTVVDKDGKVVVNKSIKTDSKGKATFKFTNLIKKGKFKAVVKYSGNRYYKTLTKKPVITII
jgi:hypothetical protein